MASTRRNFQVFSHHIQLETFQTRQKTASKWDSIQTIQRESQTKQLRLMRQKVQIKTEIVTDQDRTINKLEKIWYNLLRQWSILQHLLRNTSEPGNKWRKRTTR